MKYQELRKNLVELMEGGNLVSNVKLDVATTVNDAEKFVRSHIFMLDSMFEKAKETKIRRFLVDPSLERLKKYYLKVLKIKETK